ncbi:hypothetical protein Syun_016144 [Stephania yunnanensis]|uniref:Uncharacterized protein n=1 Tax=Stephania yunnanensis TaxID=152371 RepID=A0AAP0J499_9MAGN
MSSRNRRPQIAQPHREPPLKSRAPPPPHPPPPLLHPPHHHHHHHHRPTASAGPTPDTALAERAIAQHSEIQALLLDNQRLAATHVGLNQELSAAKKDLAHLSEVSVRVKAEGDAKVREVFDRSLKLEAELRSVDSGAGRVGSGQSGCEYVEVGEGGDGGEVAGGQWRGLPLSMRKKIRGDNLEHSLAMQKTMKALAHEIEKLHAELANAEKRARAAAIVATAAVNPGVVHSGAFGNPDGGFEGTSYVDPHSLHKGQVGADVDPNDESGTILHSSNDTQQNHLHR